MPVSKKTKRWMVTNGDQVVTNIRSKTYLGACYKAFKKMKIKTPKLTTTKEFDIKQPLTIRYIHKFKNIYCERL